LTAAPSVFPAACPEQADAWHAAGIAHDAKTCEDVPGVA
jgi:hypothetical protein